MRPTTQGPTGSTEYPGALAGRWRLAIGSGLATSAADCSAAKHLCHTRGDGRTDRADGMLISTLTGRLSNTGIVGIAEMMATPGRCCAWSAANGPGRSHQDARIASSDRVRQYSDRTMWSSYRSQQHCRATASEPCWQYCRSITKTPPSRPALRRAPPYINQLSATCCKQLCKRQVTTAIAICRPS